MSEAPSTETRTPEDLSEARGGSSAWRVGWLTPGVCRVLLVVLLLIQVVPRWFYLNSPEALDLAPDEAQGWVWGQHLDWSYYSKGPMLALIVRASSAVLGDTVFGVRFPAVLIGVLMSLMTYVLTRRFFGSERLALGAVAINFVVPMFIAGSLIMTIDPPFVLFWAGATSLFALAILEGKQWAWVPAGLLVGCSFLAKYAALMLFGGVFLALVVDRDARRYLRSGWPYVSFVVAGLCTLPVVYWNSLNNWASYAHVRADTSKGFNPVEPLNFVFGTILVVGPALAVILGVAGWKVLRGTVQEGARYPVAASQVRAARFLVLSVLPYLVMVVGSSFVTSAKINWSAPVWFGLLIVGMWFLGTRLESRETWRPWRGWFWGTVVFGLVLMPFAHNLPLLYPAFSWVHTNVRGKVVRTTDYEKIRMKLTPEERKKEISIRVWDPTARLRGWKILGADLDARNEALFGGKAFYLTDDYSEAAALEFYNKAQAPTYVMGTFVENPKRRGRLSQWDMWPERSVERGKTRLIGRDAIYLGPKWQAVVDAFDRVETLADHTIVYSVGGVGYYLGSYKVHACYGFKGFVRPADGAQSW